MKIDSLIMILGNFGIAFYIAHVINKKNKNEELKIDNCFQELDHLLKLISELRCEIQSSKEETLNDALIRFTSLIMLQIELIGKYDFINLSHKTKLTTQYSKLDIELTGDNEIDVNYKQSLLQLERTVLNIKSDIL